MGEIQWRGDIGRRDTLRSEKKHKGGLSRRHDAGFILRWVPQFRHCRKEAVLRANSAERARSDPAKLAMNAHNK